MAITLTGTSIQYNDDTIQTTNSSLQLASTVSGPTGLTSYAWTGIPNTVKRIQLHIYDANPSSGPGTQYVNIWNGAQVGQATGKAVFSSGGGNAIANFSAQQNLLHTSAYPTIPPGSILDIKFVVNNTGTYYYKYNHIGVSSGRITAGNCSITGGITEVRIGSTYSFTGLYASLYYEI
jgi:hypothetical protein